MIYIILEIAGLLDPFLYLLLLKILDMYLPRDPFVYLTIGKSIRILSNVVSLRLAFYFHCVEFLLIAWCR